MITTEQAEHFAQEWIAAWNSQDLERILSHYTDDFTIETPMAVKLLPETKGVVRGKDAVGKYWAVGLQNNPDLVFELHKVMVGVNGITIYYTNTTRGKQVAEVLWLNDAGKAYKCCVYYS